ncbi:hypothetical protein M0R19_08835 [Candidatus Pacearchaeota archaeon]|jgi:hypothetical protein|nr:hypothetical protein [bacterium]MCK9597264.1 hypothetical protein [Candidatus Pacearchaeota archaeon]
MQVATCTKCSHFNGDDSCVKEGRTKKILDIDECNTYDEKGRVILDKEEK